MKYGILILVFFVLAGNSLRAQDIDVGERSTGFTMKEIMAILDTAIQLEEERINTPLPEDQIEKGLQVNRFYDEKAYYVLKVCASQIGKKT